MNTKHTNTTAQTLLLIPLSQLRPSRRNVRRTRRTTSIPALAASIARVGLLQNLTVTADPDGEHYDVEAGDRRRAALKLLAKQKRIAADYEVPCLVVPREAARTASLTENVQREAMHPADEFEAFARLVDEGRAIEDVAADFGVSPLVVRRRLKLTNVSPRLMADYRDGNVTLEQLMALAITDDHAAQEAAFYDAPEWQRDAEALRERLTEREIDAGRDALARFVGVDAYERAGGAVRRDLFAEGERGVYLSDAALLESLARDRLAAVAEKVRAEGWAWVEVAPRSTQADLQAFRCAPQERREPKAGEAKRIATLEAQAQAIQTRLESEDGALDEATAQALYDRHDRISAKLEAIDASLHTYGAKARAFAGAVVTVDAHGEVAVRRGLLNEDEAKALRMLERGAGAADAGSDGGDRRRAPARADGVSEKLARRLSAHRTAALQVELARQPRVALAVLVYGLVSDTLLDGRCDSADLSLHITARTHEDDLIRYAPELPQSPAFAALAELRTRCRACLPNDPEALFDALLALPQDTLLDLLAFGVAATVNVVTRRPDDDNADALARAVGLDMRAWWTPTAESYFAHVSKAAIVAAGPQFAPDYGGRLSALKKDELAAKAERLAAGTGWLPPMFARQAAWIEPEDATGAAGSTEEESEDAEDADEDALVHARAA